MNDWQLDAACRGNPDPFHASAGESAGAVRRRVHEAKTICARCPVRTPCLQLALDTYDRWGIYGGTTERERRDIRRQRTAA